MSVGRALSAAAYARALERRWCELTGRSVVLSPRDWALITIWHSRGVPLELVGEAMEAAAERRGAELRALSQIGAAVEESWSVVLDGQASTISPPSEGAMFVAWNRLALSASGTALAELVKDLLERLERGADPAEVDQALDQELPAAVDAQILDAVRRELAIVLEPHRHKMSPQALEATWQRAILDRLRHRLDLPRLSGPVRRA